VTHARGTRVSGVRGWRARRFAVACLVALAVLFACGLDVLVASRVAAQEASRSVRPRGASRPAGVRARRGRRARPPVVSARYRRMRARWHRAAPPEARRRWESQAPRPPLVLVPVGGGESVSLVPLRDDGGFDAEALARAATALAARRSGATHPIEPALLDRVYRAQRRFRAPFVHVISGFREDRATSRHTQGRAMDIVLPGVRDAVLAAYLRGEGFSGVGTYAVSGFVHVDVRRRSYFWVDGTAPGRRSRARGVLARQAAAADARALARGVARPFADGPPDDDADDGEDAAPEVDAVLAGDTVAPEVGDLAASEAAARTDAP
jgi:hypothetical protein